ncbi:SHOCT domain-containing protein [Desulfosporosinus fructosivorans]
MLVQNCSRLWSLSFGIKYYCFQSQGHTSLDIFNDRYARGEINREEYLERKQELYGQKPPISIKKE